MADAKRCDRCGTYYVEKEKKYKVGRDILASIKFVSSQNTWIKYFDLCDECAKKLVQFMKQEKEEEKESESAGKFEMGESVDILPCVCGHMPVSSVWLDYNGHTLIQLKCPNCGFQSIGTKSIVETAKDWNKRVKSEEV